MANVGSLVLDLALQSAQFLAGIRNAQNATNGFAKATSAAMGMIKGAFGGIGALLSIDLLTGRIQEAFDYGDAIVDLSDRTGVATQTIQEFRYAAQMSGSSVESADAALDKFAKNLGNAQMKGSAMAKTFNDLGVSAKNPEAALREFMDGMAKLPNVAQRNAAATAVMGKSANDLTVLLGSGTQGFDELATAARNYGIVIDDSVLRNGGQVNDQLDTMKMILNAQMANSIIQNADALMAFANAAIQAGAAAANFFQQMSNRAQKSVAFGIDGSSDLGYLMRKRLSGKSIDQIPVEARTELMGSHDGRDFLFKGYTKRYNDEVRAGRKDSPFAQVMLEERRRIAVAEASSRKSVAPLPKPETGGTFHAPVKSSPAKKTSHSTHTKSPEEIAATWERDFLDARSSLYSSLANLSLDPTDRAEYDASRTRNDYYNKVAGISQDTGTDQEIREGKKRYTAVQAEQLKQIQKEIFDAEYDKIIRDRDVQIARDALSIKDASLRNDMDILQAEQGLARSAKERRRLALSLVDKQFEQERLQLEAIVASKDATEAEKKIAEERLKILARLKSAAVEGVKKQTQGPLESYLDQIPKTSEQINEALKSVQVDGLEKLQDGIQGIIQGTMSIGGAFSSVVNTVLDGIMKIVLQQALIKPLAGLLVGSGEGGGTGGLLGSVLGSVLKGTVKGARANGGYTGAGTYLVGERGPELATFGSNANITPNRALRRFANDNGGGSGAMNITFGNITSNDPAAIKRATMEGIAQALPMIAQQASDKTMDRLRRRQM